MNEQEIYDLYVLQSRNVRHLKQVQNILIKDINLQLKKNDEFQVEIKTKLLALLYCALSEAQFTQIVHTPKGFSYSEIELIKNQRSIFESWKIMVDLAMDKVGNWNANPDLLQRRDRIHTIIASYIGEPQELRNKIAHGQWVHALNSKNTKENLDSTERVKSLDVVIITIWTNVHQFLAFIIRDLVQSPKVGFHNNYWSNLVALETFLVDCQNWTIDKRRIRIQKKTT